MQYINIYTIYTVYIQFRVSRNHCVLLRPRATYKRVQTFEITHSLDCTVYALAISCKRSICTRSKNTRTRRIDVFQTLNI